MDYLKLEYFYRVAQYEHITKAAQSLHISQPALTKMIKFLEKECGAPLLYKVGRNIRLTEFGQHLKKRLDEIVPKLDGLAADLEDFRAESQRKIRLNVLAASTFVTDAVIGYQQQNADAVFQLLQNEEAADCDIIVTTNVPGSVKVPSFDTCCTVTEKIYLAVPRSSAYAACNAVDLHDMREECFIQLAGSRRFRTVCDACCAAIGFSPHTTFESDSPVAVKNIIAANAGIGFWPEFSWGVPDSDKIVLLPIAAPVFQRTLVIGICHGKENLHPVADFYRYLTARLPDIRR